MKAIIEKHLEDPSEFKLRALNHVLKSICMSEDEDDLRVAMIFKSDHYSSPNIHFIWGFGSSHMWVHERGNSERLLIVEF